MTWWYTCYLYTISITHPTQTLFFLNEEWIFPLATVTSTGDDQYSTTKFKKTTQKIKITLHNKLRKLNIVELFQIWSF